MSQKIRIAITGGGVAGASLTHALLPHAHLDVHIFEAAPQFKEAGAAIGVSRQALAALELIGPSAPRALERAGAVEQKGLVVVLGEGEHQGTVVGGIDTKETGKRLTSGVHRADFLRELLVDVAEERMHTSKKLDSVKELSDGSLELHFTDGTIHNCDILIGADGIRSTVRKLILGEDDPAAHPQNSGWWAVWSLQPYALARSYLGDGPVNIDDAREYGWAGDGTFMMHALVSNGELVTFIITAYDEKAGDKWNRTISADEIREAFKNWPPYVVKAIDEMLCNVPEQNALYLWDHLPARQYVSGRLAVMGDAAHATTPWQASGGGMSIEDSLILSSVLGRATNVSEALVGLRAYDEIRRPRTQRIVESSRGTGDILTGRGKETKLDPVAIDEKLFPRWDFIHEFDVAKHREDALELMDKYLASEGVSA